MSSKQFGMLLVGGILIALIVGILAKNSTGNLTTEPTPSASAELVFGDQSKQSRQTLQTNPQQTNVSVKQYSKFPEVLPLSELKNKKAVIETEKGNIEFEIYPEASKAASNFVFLAKDKFYDGLKFHRVVPGFVIQGGDPLGNGRGGPGYQFEDEPVNRKYTKGIVAMANAGKNTNGSQFFIMLEDKLDLPADYTIFGKVIKGQDVVGEIEVGDVMKKVMIEQLR